MSDKFTEITNQSWFSRIGGAIKGMLFGIVLVVAGIVLLFTNEGRAVKTHKALVESQGQVVSIDALQTNPAMNGKLVHISGEASTGETLSDDLLQVSAKALKLNRVVETYQWEETEKSEEKKNLGGGTETVTTYEYRKVWTKGTIDSSSFKQPEGHSNPIDPAFKNEHWSASAITLGAYALSTSHKNGIKNFQALALPTQENLPTGLSKHGDKFYYGKNYGQPEVGDQRISFEWIPPQIYSAIGSSSGSILNPHTTSNGHEIALIEPGSLTADAMFEQAKNANNWLTWLLRAAGLIIFIIAFAMILKPLSVIADVVPLIGNIVGMGTGFVSIVLGFISALITICIAWITYRPLLGIAILVVIATLIYLLKRRSREASREIAVTPAAEMSS